MNNINILFLSITVLYIGQVLSYKFFCEKCEPNRPFDDEEEFVNHTEWHLEQFTLMKQKKLAEFKREREAHENMPRRFFCHHCPDGRAFNNSVEFVEHIDTEHVLTTAVEEDVFIPKGKAKIKGGGAGGGGGPAFDGPFDGPGGGFGGDMPHLKPKYMD